MEENNVPKVSKEVLWYLDNYILLKDYYDRTISRIAARCVRMGNIAIEEYPFYSYILDVLEEISDTGDYVLKHQELHPYVEKKIQGGMAAFKKNLNEYQQELKNNASPDMIKGDALEVERMREALGGKVDKAHDPTVGAGMSMEELMNKLTANPAEIQAMPAAPMSEPTKKIIKIKRTTAAPAAQAMPEKADVNAAAETEIKTEKDEQI